VVKRLARWLHCRLLGHDFTTFDSTDDDGNPVSFQGCRFCPALDGPSGKVKQ
jgi:hypothetical protein